MLHRWLSVLVLALGLTLAACTPAGDGGRGGAEEGHMLSPFPESAEARLFAEEHGVTLPEGVSIENILERQSGLLLSEAERVAVSNTVSVVPCCYASDPAAQPERASACAPVWRHAFVFYDNDGAPLGAILYNRDCGTGDVVGADGQSLPAGDYSLRFDSDRLNSTITAHGAPLFDHISADGANGG